MKGRKPGNTPENWLRCPQAWLLVSQGPYKPSSASLIPGTVVAVDESTACSWPVCDLCGSERLERSLADR